jgi:hypothetical protein
MPMAILLILMQMLVQAVSGRLKLLLCQNFNCLGSISGHNTEEILRDLHGQVDTLIREKRHLVVAMLLLLNHDQPPPMPNDAENSVSREAAAVGFQVQELLHRSRAGALEAKQSLEAGYTSLFEVRYESTMTQLCLLVSHNALVLPNFSIRWLLPGFWFSAETFQCTTIKLGCCCG